MRFLKKGLKKTTVLLAIVLIAVGIYVEHVMYDPLGFWIYNLSSALVSIMCWMIAGYLLIDPEKIIDRGRLNDFDDDEEEEE